MAKQVIGNRMIDEDGNEVAYHDHSAARRAATGQGGAATPPPEWKLNVTVLKLRDGKQGLYIRTPHEGDTRIGVQVPGEPDIRRVGVDQVNEVKDPRGYLAEVADLSGAHEFATELRDAAEQDMLRASLTRVAALLASE